MNPMAYGLFIPSWIRLAMPEDVGQEIMLAGIIGRTEAQRRDALLFRLRELRRTQWERRPTRPTRVPSSLRLSRIKAITGYRTDSGAHQIARLTVNPAVRRAVARKGAEARWRDETFSAR